MTIRPGGRTPSTPDGHCDGFTRAQAIRRVLASDKLPVAREWDPRMPIPAGAGIDRRRFLAGALGGVMTVYGAGRLGLTNRMLGDGIARAAVESADSPILVSLFVQGGLDGLSLLAPAGDSLYQQLRPTLGVAPGSGMPFREDPSLTWHPSAASFAQLHDAGKVTMFPGIGYTSPDMSPLHLPSLLGGGRHRCVAADRVDGAVPGRGW